MIYDLAVGGAVLMGMLVVLSGFMVTSDYVEKERIEDKIDVALGRKIVRSRTARKKKVRSPGAVKAGDILKTVGSRISRSGILTAQNMDEMHASMQLAGIRDQAATAIFIGGKLVGMLSMPAIFGGLLYIMDFHIKTIALLSAAAAAFGLMLPNIVLKNIKTKYQKHITDAMPDSLDLLVISVDSGLGLEQAMARVSNDIEEIHPILSQEFRVTGTDLQINPDVEKTLKNFAARTGVQDTSKLSSTLIQSIVYGTPLSQALHTLSKEMRTEALFKFEETVAKLPAKMTVPMVLFILPALVLVVVGPSIGPVMAALRSMGHH